MSTTKGVKALRLTLGGAPPTWHTVVGFPGWFHTDMPVPVGGPGETPADVADAADKDPGCPLKLERITEKEADRVRGLLRELAGNAVLAVREAARDGVDEQVTAEHAAVASVETKE